MLKALLFDLDGTLVDLCEVHRAAFRQALADFPEAPHPRYSGADAEAWFLPAPGAEAVLESDLEALPTKEKLRKLGVTGDLASRVAAAKQEHTLKGIAELKPNPDIVRMFERLRGFYPSVRMACVTNSVRPTAEGALKQAGLLTFMDTIVSNEDSAFPKPFPDLYEVTLARLGVSAKEALVLEDHPRGLDAGVAAGCTVLPADFRTLPYLEGLLARLLTPSP
jgi:beta-phosphoglucomutase-like phosphatase (HAD superfamily)